MFNWLLQQKHKLVFKIKNAVRRFKLKRAARKQGCVYLFRDLHGELSDISICIAKAKGYVQGKTTLEVLIHPDCVITKRKPEQTSALRLDAVPNKDDKYVILNYGTIG